MSENAVSFEHVSFYYEKSNIIFDNMTFSIEKGDSVGIVGANGVGKSTLLKLLVGLEFPKNGNIFVDSIDVSPKSISQVRKHLGYVFQDSNNQLFSSTVYEDVAFGPKNYGLSKEDVLTKTMQALSLVHIENLKDRPIYKLSGGEKKLASIACVLSMEPDILLMDEPSVALDPYNRRNLIHILNDLDMTKIIASHDLDFILDTCNKCILFSDTGIVANGNTKEILSDKKLMEAHRLELPLSLSKSNL